MFEVVIYWRGREVRRIEAPSFAAALRERDRRADYYDEAGISVTLEIRASAEGRIYGRRMAIKGAPAPLSTEAPVYA